MNTDYKNEFLLEEFRQNWAYIHQCETVRLKQFQIFFLIVGVFASSLVFFIKEDGGINEAISGKYSFIISSASIFLSIFLFCLLMFVFLQKRGYEEYRDINKIIKMNMLGQQGPSKESNWSSLCLSKAFTWWFATLLVTWLALFSMVWFVAPICVFNILSVIFITLILLCIYRCKKSQQAS